MHILRLENIHKSYHNQKSEHVLLKGINLEVPRGKITALIGGNGTGKTTLFNIISGLLDQDKGNVFFNSGKEWKRINRKAAFQRARLGLGRLFQDIQIFPYLSIEENMMMADKDTAGEGFLPAILNSRKWRKKEQNKKQKVHAILEELFRDDQELSNQIMNNLQNAVSTLSYGQQRLIALAQLMMGDYSLVLLDEPTAGVNVSMIDRIAKLILLMKKQGLSIFIIEHNMRFVRSIADHCMFTSEGTILTEGSPEQILSNSKIKQLYLGL